LRFLPVQNLGEGRIITTPRIEKPPGVEKKFVRIKKKGLSAKGIYGEKN